MSRSFRLASLSPRLLPFALVSALTAGAGAQTAPQLLPYTAKLLAGGGTVTYSQTSSSPVTFGPTCSTGTTSSGFTPTDKYGDGCLATEITLTGPRYAIADKTGAVFFSDYTNGLLRRIDPVTGIVTAVAGGATASPASGTACGSYTSTDAGGDGCLSTAVKIVPYALAFDAAGNLYFTDYYNYNVRKIAATAGVVPATGGVISTVAGNPGGHAASYGYAANPSTCAATSTATCIVAGSTSDYLDDPYGLAFDAAGNLYIAEEYKNAILVVNTTAATETIAGVVVPPGTKAKIVGASTASGYSGTNFCPNGNTGTYGCTYGNYTTGVAAADAPTDSPYAVAVDTSGNVYFADEYNNAVAKINAAGVLTNYAGLYPQSGNGSKVANTTRGLTTSGTFAVGSDYGLVADPFGNIYFTDALNGYIWRVDGATQTGFVVAGGGAATTAGSACASGSAFTATDAYGDGCPGSLAKFGSSGTSYASTGIFGITTDAYADVFVGDTGTNQVREVASGTQFGNTGATQTDYVDIHFAANDGPIGAGAYTITAGASIFSLGTAKCTTNNDNNAAAGNTTDCILPVTATPTASGPYSGVLTVKSNLVPAGTNFPLNGDFVQSPVTRVGVSVAGVAGCSGTTYANVTPLTLTAAITANGPTNPTGTMTFALNGTTIGSTAVVNIGTTAAPVYGAVFMYTFTTPGAAAITATYVPTTNSYFTGSTSSATNITIVTPSYTLTNTGYQQATVKAGQTALYSFFVNQNAYIGTISFTVTGLPANTSYSVAPVSLTGIGCVVQNTVALSINTQQQVTVQPGSFGGTGRGGWQLLSIAAGLGLALLVGLRRRLPLRCGQLLMALALLLTAAGSTGCGKAVGTVLQPATVAGTYPVVVSAVSYSGSTLVGSSQVPITLIVQ